MGEIRERGQAHCPRIRWSMRRQYCRLVVKGVNEYSPGSKVMQCLGVRVARVTNDEMYLGTETMPQG